MKIKLTQEQSDNMIAKMLVKDYKRMYKRDSSEDDHLLNSMVILLKDYYLSPTEYLEFVDDILMIN